MEKKKAEVVQWYNNTLFICLEAKWYLPLPCLDTGFVARVSCVSDDAHFGRGCTFFDAPQGPRVVHIHIRMTVYTLSLLNT